jgi:ubiquinone biosynthesis protein
MLDARLVPTPLGDPHTRRVVEVRPPTDPPRFRQVLLVGRFLRFGLELGWRRLRGPVTPLELGTSLREIFESLGGLWIKLGQLVAMRRDLLPGDFCRELGRLQDRATGFPGSLARRIIGRTWAVRSNPYSPISRTSPSPPPPSASSTAHASSRGATSWR